MGDYARIVTKIRETPWLMTPEALGALLNMVDERIKLGHISDEELTTRIKAFHGDGGRDSNGINNDYGVGIISLEGPIFGKANLMTEMSGATSLEVFQQEFRAMMDDNRVKSIILDIDSPGGTSDMVHEVGEEIREAREYKPIYAIANTMAGSAAYWLAAQASEFYATPSSAVGSIGAYTVHEDRSVADAHEGRRFTFISAGPYKVEGNPHEPISTEARDYRQGLIDELYGEFVENVSLGRRISTDKIIADFGGGRMMSAKTALNAGMIDDITSFDGLVNHAVTSVKRPSAVGVSGRSMAARLESKDWEHSEPGTGSPPEPRTDEDGSDDIAIKRGWRKQTEPTPLDKMGGYEPAANAGGGNMAEADTLAQIRELFGLSADTDDSVLVARVRKIHGEWTELNESVYAADEEARLAKEFPKFYEDHLAAQTERRNAQAEKFVEKASSVLRPEGDNYKSTGFGLSALAMETLAEAHKKFADGKGSLADFENSVNAIMHGGVVEYGERGSSVPVDIPYIDPGTTSGSQAARQMFAQKVSETKAEEGKPWSGNQRLAVKEASRRYPDLAKGYKTNLPA